MRGLEKRDMGRGHINKQTLRLLDRSGPRVDSVKTMHGNCHSTAFISQVSIHVAAPHQTSQHQTLKPQIQMVGPDLLNVPNFTQPRFQVKKNLRQKEREFRQK